MFSGARRRARVPVARRESVHTRDGGVWLHAAWTMNSKPPADTTGIEWNHAGMKGWSAPTHAVTITNVEGVQWHPTLRAECLSTASTRIVQCMTGWSYVFLCLTYMHSCLDTPFCCCIGNIVHIMSKVCFFRKLNKTPSPLLSDSSFRFGIVKPGTSRGKLPTSLSLTNLRFHCFFVYFSKPVWL